MKALTAAAEVARKRPWAAPRYLYQIDFTAPSAKTIRLQNQYSTALTQEWLPFVVDEGSLDAALNIVDVDGRPATFELTLLNNKPIEGKARLSDLIRTATNVTGTYEWLFATMTVSQLFDGLGPGDEVKLGVFFLEEPTSITDETLTVRMIDQAGAIEDKLAATVVNRVDFPNCADSAIGRSIPRPFGNLVGVVAIPVVDSVTSRLNGGISTADTTLTLDDVSRFGTTGTGHLDSEHISWTGKTGTVNGQLTGLTRGVSPTTAAIHKSRATFYEIRSGASAYRYAAGENTGAFLIRNLKNVLVNGEPPPVTPSIELAASIGGKSLAVINFPSEAKFSTPGATTAERDVAVTTVTVSPLNGGATSSQTRTVTPSSIGGTTSTSRSMNCRVVRSGNLAGTINYWHVLRRLSGGTDVQVAAGSFAANVGGTQSFSHTAIYASTADEIITFEYQYNNTNDGALQLIFDNYHVKDSNTSSAGGTDIGEVSCDIEGLQDDGSGTITGTPSLLLENPADITRFILTQLYPVSSALLGSTFGATRAQLVAGGYAWGFALEFSKFSQLRRKLGEQARCTLFLDGGLWQYKYLPDDLRADLTLDYLKDAVTDIPFTVKRTSRVDVKNSLTVSAQRDASQGRFQYVTVKEDLTQPGLTDRIPGALELDFVQSTTVADLLGNYWLNWWKQQHFEIELGAVYNLLALESVDYVRITNHPVLAPWPNLLFRVIGKQYSPKDETVRIHAIEAANIAASPAPDNEEEEMNRSFNSDMRIWGGGTAVAPTGYTVTGAGATVARDGTNKKFGLYSAALTRVGTDCYLAQTPDTIFEDLGLWLGASCVIGCWVRATAGSRGQIAINDGVGTTISAFHTGGSGWEFITISRTIDNAATKVEPRLYVVGGNTTVQFQGLMVKRGATVLTDFVPSGWRGRKAIIPFAVSATVGAASTVFLTSAFSSTSEIDFNVPFKGVARNLYANGFSNPGTSQSYTYTLRKALADTALTCSHSGASATESNDQTHEVEYAKGDKLDLKLVTSATATLTFHQGMVEFEEIP